MLNFFKVTKIHRPVLLIAGIIAIGTIGYIYIEDYNLLDALYMTVITIGTVGFGEVHPLSDIGRIFTSILILTTLGIFAYSITLISHSFVEGEARRYFTVQYLRRKIKKMKDHVIICGLGRTGRAACHELLDADVNIVIVDRRGGEKAPKSESVVVVAGDATDEKTLIEAGIRYAKAIICTLPSDADNVFVILTAKGLNPKINIVSRASQENSYSKMYRAGASSVIRPEEIGGNMMANMVLKPDVTEFWRLLSFKDGAPENYREMPCSDFPEEFIGKPIHDLHVRRETGVSIIGYKTADGEILINPLLNRDLERSGKLFLLGTKSQFDIFDEFFLKKKRH